MLKTLFAVAMLSVLSQYSWFTHAPSDSEIYEQDMAGLSVTVAAAVDTD